MSDYDEFLERYARDNHISKEVAETHAIVQETKKFYEEVEHERKRN